MNARLEANKIRIKESPYQNHLSERKFNIYVGHIYATFRFYDHDVVEKYEIQRIETIKKRIAGNRDFMFSPIGESIFKKKNIIYLSMVETNYLNPLLHEKFGFNLALVKTEADTYGKWYIAKFSDSGLRQTSRKDFALDLDYFLEEFEKSFMTHVLSVDFRELVDTDLHRIIKEVLSA